MEQKKKRFDLATVMSTTGMNQHRLRGLRKRLEDYDNDIDKKARLEKWECKCCFYILSKIGGAAMTKKPCNACGKVIMYSSTCTGAVCKECGKKYRVCTHCGGDINEKNRRTL